MLDVAKKYNMKIVIDDKLPADLSDMSATLTKFKALSLTSFWSQVTQKVPQQLLVRSKR